MLRQVLVANDRKFPIGLSLTELVLRHPDEDWNAFTDEALKLPGGLSDRDQREARRLTPEARAQTLARLDEFPASVRGSLACALVDAWALEEPRQATEWAIAHAATTATDAPGNDPLRWALVRWISTDEVGVIAWWSQLPESPQRDTFGATIAAKLATEGKIDRALELFHPEFGQKWTGVAVAIASAKAEDDPAGAAAWLDSLPADLNTQNAIAPLVQRWVGRDAGAAARWVETQPAGERRDAALKAYSVAATELDPAAAGEWAAAIADPTTRAQAAEAVFREMNRRDPPAARAFLRSLPETDKAWTERLLRAGE
jgi:hypothetical protein